MSGSVLFDAPGPKARLRHLLLTIAGGAVLLGILAYFIVKLVHTGQFEYVKWEPFVTPKYLQALGEGTLDTVKMALSAVVAAVVFGIIFGVGKLSEHRWVRWPSWFVVEFWRAVPVLLMMILIFYAWGITRGTSGAYWSVVIALMVYNGAVLAEVFRAGVNAVPKGQAEAAYAIGMRKTQVMMMIQLPQAVKIMLPALISQCVVALKDTSLGYAVSAPGLTKVGKQIYGDFDFEQNHIATVIVLAAIYIGLNLVLTAIATWVQKRFVGEHKIDVQRAATGVEQND